MSPLLLLVAILAVVLIFAFVGRAGSRSERGPVSERAPERPPEPDPMPEPGGDEEPGVSGPAWRCGRCGVECEGHFDVCWNCGADRSTVKVALPAGGLEDVASSSTAGPIASPQRATASRRSATQA